MDDAVFFEKSAMSPTAMLITYGSIAVLIIVLVIISFIQRKRGQKNVLKVKRFRALARKVGVKKKNINFLLQIVKENSLSRPYSIFESKERLENIFMAAHKHLMKSPLTKETEEGHILLSQLRKLFEIYFAKKTLLKSTRSIPNKQNIYISLPNVRTRKECQVIRMRRRFFEVEIFGGIRKDTKIKGEKIGILLTMSRGREIFFESRAINVKKKDSSLILRLSHSKSVTKKSFFRRYKRKIVNASCTITPLKKSGKKFTPNQPPISGNLIDISTGGCGILLPKQLQPRTFITVSSNLKSNTNISFTGKVLRNYLDRNKHYRHSITFVKTTRNNYINLNNFIYSE